MAKGRMMEKEVKGVNKLQFYIQRWSSNTLRGKFINIVMED